MSVSPIITFKAGICEADYNTTPPRITPVATPGFLYLYIEDELLHFCWRPRDASLANPELDLMMVPTDAYFKPYLGVQKVPNTSPVNGRIFMLKFRSSAQRYWFWLQSREQPPGQPKKFSPRDLRLGQIVNSLLQGEELDTSSELATLRSRGGSGGDDDAMMEDVEPDDQNDSHHRADSGGAGADATGGDVREEGEQSREGGSDGGRAADTAVTDQTSAAIQNFLNSLQGGGMGGGASQQEKTFTTLAELLPASSTIPMIETAEPSFIENLLVHHLPPSLVFLEHQVDDFPDEVDEETMRASVQALSEEQQKGILRRVLRSPQFTQGLVSLTAALRDGGLPTVSEALQVHVKNGGYTGPDRRVPLSGGDAVEAFVEGVKSSVKKTADGGASSVNE